ncbi:hypothetical protein ACB094_03G033300 [Castanea mollissima]
MIYLRRRSLNCKLVADTCEARDAPSKGLDRIPAQTQFHFRVSLSQLRSERERERERRRALAGREKWICSGLQWGPSTWTFIHNFFFPTVHLHRSITALPIVTKSYEIIFASKFLTHAGF